MFKRTTISLSSFNPHPAVKLGATTGNVAYSIVQRGFNPHPAVKLGATTGNVAYSIVQRVSILTQR